MEVQPSQRPALRIVAPVFVLLFAAATYGIGIRPYRRAAEARYWPEIPCTVVNSEVRPYRNSKGEERFETVLRYTYETPGRLLSGTRVHFGMINEVGDGAGQEAIAAYPPGKTTTCRVNPEDPFDSVLDPAVRGFATPLMGSIFGFGVLMSCAASIAAWRKPAG